ncbi:MAG: hypothetical protein V4676_08450 [Bacteroidota bacterium]
MKQHLLNIQTLLAKIERSYAAQRAALITGVQNKIWDGPEIENENINYLLTTFAGDLNFYEPIERDRDESLGYYGDEKLLQLIKEAQLQIEIYLGDYS